MKKLTTTNMTNAGITAVELDSEINVEMNKRILTALRKFSSSRKTKSVHKIVSSGVISPAMFNGNAADYLVAPYFKNKTLRQLKFNLFFFDDSLDRAGAVGHASKLEIIQKKIQKEKTFLSDKQVFNLEQLKIDKKELGDNLLDSLDYIKLVDGIYFGWLLLLSQSALEDESRTKSKIVAVTSDILADILKKMYLQVNAKIEPEVHQLLEAISIYFIKIYYYGETAQYALGNMEKGFNEETLDAIRKTKITQFKEFNDLSTIMKEAQLLPLTQNTFDHQMDKMFGKYGYEVYIQQSLMNFIAFMANLANPSSLFKDAYEIDDESHKRLEELLLNESKGIKIDKVEH